MVSVTCVCSVCSLSHCLYGVSYTCVCSVCSLSYCLHGVCVCSFTDTDQQSVEEVFRYGSAILLSALAAQKEGRVKEKMQVCAMSGSRTRCRYICYGRVKDKMVVGVPCRCR